MNILKIKVIGPRASGKTVIMNHIKQMLTEYDIHWQEEICEDIDTENLTITLSRNDIKALAQG